MPITRIDGAALGNALTGVVTLGVTDASAFGGRLNVTNGGQASAFFWNFGIGSGHVGFGASSSNLKLYNTYADGILANGKGIDIDIAGRALNPNQPYFSVWRSTDQPFSGSTTTIIGFNSIANNTGNHYSNTNSRFTAPVNGVYYFRWQTMLMSLSTYTFINTSLFLNGNLTEEIMSSTANQNSNFNTLSGSKMIFMNANDFADVRIYHNGVAGSPFIRAGSAMNRWEGILLG